MSPCEVDITFNEICSMFYCRDVSCFAMLWQQSWVTPAKVCDKISIRVWTPVSYDGQRLGNSGKENQKTWNHHRSQRAEQNRHPQSGWCKKSKYLSKSQYGNLLKWWSYLEILTQGRVWNKVVTGLCVCCEWSCPRIRKENSIEPLYIIQNWNLTEHMEICWMNILFCVTNSILWLKTPLLKKLELRCPTKVNFGGCITLSV